jgi:putative FmdB family regulatory protein
MPLYEYRCENDGTTITLLRPMAAADDPVEDPDGRGRTFTRVHSTFSVGEGSSAAPPPPGPCAACGMNGQCPQMS